MKTKIYVLTFIIVSMLFGHITYAISAELVNIAPLYGIASADATWSERPVENAIDGDYISHWSAGSHGTASNPHWLKVDLQQDWQVSEIGVYFVPWSGSPYFGYTNVYNLYVSSDGSSWTLIGSGTIAEHTNPEVYSDTYILSDQSHAIRYVKYEVVGGTHWAGLAEMEVMSSCDFSIQPGIEKCFGGIGNQCKGDAPFLPFEKHEDTCYVDGYMSVGSILHDKCCLMNNNDGFMCDGIKSLRKLPCYAEFYWATEDTTCGRFWAKTFGPYPIGNEGDDLSQDLRAPSDAHVHPDNGNFCQSGQCQMNPKGKPFGKGLCRYCICK